MKQHHLIEIFSADCPLCKQITDVIEIGKCEGCKQVVQNVNNTNDEIKTKMSSYGVKSVPTTIIDGKIKIEGIPEFPWICSEDLYKRLEKEYPLRRD